jgi:hypothetical protein
MQSDFNTPRMPNNMPAVNERLGRGYSHKQQQQAVAAAAAQAGPVAATPHAHVLMVKNTFCQHDSVL